MGRPASLESRSRGPWYRGLGEEPELPHQGNRPRKRNSNQDSKTQLGPQRVVLPLRPL